MRTPRNKRFWTSSGHLPPTFCPFPAGAVEEVAGRDKSIQMGNVHCITMFPPTITYSWLGQNQTPSMLSCTRHISGLLYPYMSNIQEAYYH